MSIFEYLGVFLSVIVGLAVAHLIGNVGTVVHRRSEVRLYWVHLLWVFNIFTYLIAFWWFLFYWSRLEDWSFGLFLFVIGYAVVLYLVAVLLFPTDIPKGFDFRAHFYQTRHWFFGAQAAAALLDVGETTLKAEAGLRDVPGFYFIFISSLFVFSLLAAWTRSSRFHAVYSICWVLAQSAFALTAYFSMV